MPDYSWPPSEGRRVMGKRLTRLDGAVKASGRAKYGSDIKQPDLLFGALLTSPHAHARVISPAGTEIQWAGTEIAGVAAVSMDIARDAVRRIKVDYEVLPHAVDD